MSITEVAATVLRENSSSCLDEIVRESLPSVRFIANRLASRIPVHVEVEDLVQAGVIGLLQSADRFDAQRGAKFETYANRRVQGAMLDYLRSLDWKPRSVRQKSRRVEQAHHAAEQRLGRRATEEDVAQEIGITVTELEQWTNTFAMVPCGEQPEETRTPLLSSMATSAESPEDILAKKQMRGVLIDAIDRLPETERLVLSLYYYEQLTMQEVGQLLGVGQARVSQLHSQAIMRLRKRLRSAEAPRETPCKRETQMEATLPSRSAGTRLPRVRQRRQLMRTIPLSPLRRQRIA